MFNARVKTLEIDGYSYKNWNLILLWQLHSFKMFRTFFVKYANADNVWKVKSHYLNWWPWGVLLNSLSSFEWQLRKASILSIFQARINMFTIPNSKTTVCYTNLNPRQNKLHALDIKHYVQKTLKQVIQPNSASPAPLILRIQQPCTLPYTDKLCLL